MKGANTWGPVHEEIAMSQYLVLIYGDEQAIGQAGQPVWDDVTKGHIQFGETYGSALAGGNKLKDGSTATSVRPDGNGGFTITDGPFAETKEVLGGYYLVEAASLDEALAMAKAIPMPFGGVEVRPVDPLM